MCHSSLCICFTCASSNKRVKMNLISWLYFSIFVLVFSDIAFATMQHRDIQKITMKKNNNAVNHVTRMVDYIFGVEPAIHGRTFAQKRLQFLLMPMMYKMGVMTTILIVLTVISLKGLTVGMILLVLKLSALFGKFYTATHQYHHQASWLSPAQPVHLHVHSDGIGHHNHPYNSGEPLNSVDNENYYYKG